MLPTNKPLDVGYLQKAKSSFETLLKDCETAWKMEMMRRARIAYHRQGGTRFPCPYLSHVVLHKKVYYAYLADSTGNLAVYRLTNENCFRRKAKVWPKAIESATISRRATALYVQSAREGSTGFHQLN